MYPIYNHNWRNISTIYIYNRISIKRNILTIKKRINREVCRAKDLSAARWSCTFMHSFLTYEVMELPRERYWTADKLPLCNRIKGFDKARCTILHFLSKLWTAFGLSGDEELNIVCNLIIKPTRCTNFSNLFLEWNCTCFGQVFCHYQASSTVYTAIGICICHLGYADCFLAGSGWNILIPLASNQY
jgi:hypothetical protein